MITNAEDSEWLDPPKKLTAKEKAKLTRARRKHYETISSYREQLVAKHFAEHIEHLWRIVDTNYLSDIFVGETITCDCGTVLEITKEMLEEINGGEYKLILTP